ncbi:GAP family protein [Mycobacterium sp. Marseille-P9652]|uniref:GAP family protein n=1 Tax=Mycobacterium sp. Marseille-P9652 TaxID=2654950 RepID=UPI0012E79BFB|nr:GAP family protein [Mycobacterium sp. Marseille-P9652]
MWTIVVVCGLGMAIDPVRIGLAVIMMSQRRPFRNLMAFWLGGVVAGVAVGLAALVVMRDLTTMALHFVVDVLTRVRVATVIFMGGRLQIAFGVLAFVILAVMTIRARTAARLSVGGADMGGGHVATLVEERPANVFQRLGARSHDILSGDRLWPPFFVGLCSSFPPYEGWLVVAAIGASGAAVGTQFGALMLFMLLLLAVIEIPLLCYLAVPAKTHAVVERIHEWMRTYRLQLTQAIIGFTGVMCLFQGVTSL